MNLVLILLVLLQAAVKISVSTSRGSRLAEMNMKVKTFTVSGFSAGGSMASQLYLAHSNLIRGIAIFSGLLYQCGEGPELEFHKLYQCTRGTTNLTRTTRKIQQLSNLGWLDPLQNLQFRRHFIEQGQLDVVVRPDAARVVYEFFRQFSRNVRLVELPHTHAAPTERCGGRCATRLIPLNGIVSCGYSVAYDGLNYIYNGGIVHPKEDHKMMRCHFRRDEKLSGLIEFSQREFLAPGLPSVGMADTGFLYVPGGCRRSAAHCRLHVHFHGCMSDNMMRGRQYVQNSEFLAIAEANDLIVLFPQTTFVPTSLSGFLQCWDMIGITEFGNKYWGTKRGRQLGAIYRMIERIHGEEINRIEYSINSNRI